MPWVDDVVFGMVFLLGFFCLSHCSLDSHCYCLVAEVQLGKRISFNDCECHASISLIHDSFIIWNSDSF